MKIKIKIWTELNQGIYKSDREARAVPTIFDATKANLEFARAVALRESWENRGAYGSIGAGDTYVAIVDDDGGELWKTDMEDNEEGELPALTERGTLTVEQLDGIRKKVFNGNNFVSLDFETIESLAKYVVWESDDQMSEFLYSDEEDEEDEES